MKPRRAAGGIALALILAGCSVTSLDELDYHVAGEATASAEAVVQKAEAWAAEHAWQVNGSPTAERLGLQRALAGQNRAGEIVLTTSAGASAGTTAYDIRASTRILGVKARDNDAEVIADAKTLDAALRCPAAGWPTCP